MSRVKAIVWCEECLMEYEIVPKTEIEDHEEELVPKVCPFCKNDVDEYFYDDIDDED